MQLNRPSVSEMLPRVRAYCAIPGNEVGGNLHLVLDDGNVKDHHVRFCLEQATGAGDQAGAALATELLAMTKTQRIKLASLLYSRQ